MQEEVKRMDQVAFDKDQVKYPDPADSPIAGLPVFEDGFACKKCLYLCRHRTGIQSHCKEVHDWVNLQKRGRQKKDVQQEKIWEEGQHCQRFFEFAQWKKYFQVSKQPEQGREHRSSEANDEKIERLVEEMEESMVEKRKERVIGDSSSRYLPNPWLDFVGWDEHLKNFKRSELLQMTEGGGQEGREERTEEQKQEDRELAQACVANQRLIRKAMATC